MKRWALVCDRSHTFVDADGTDGRLAQVEGPIGAATIGWFNAQPPIRRAGIVEVTIGLSAWAKVERGAPLDVVLVVFRCHPVQFGNDMLRPGPNGAGCLPSASGHVPMLSPGC